MSKLSNGQNQNLEHLAQLGVILLQVMEGIIRGLELALHQITAILHGSQRYSVILRVDITVLKRFGLHMILDRQSMKN